MSSTKDSMKVVSNLFGLITIENRNMKKDEKQLILSAVKRQVKKATREFFNDYPEMIHVTSVTQETYEKVAQLYYPYLDRYLDRTMERAVDYSFEKDDIRDEVQEIMLKEIFHVIVDIIPIETYLSFFREGTVTFEGDRVVIKKKETTAE